MPIYMTERGAALLAEEFKHLAEVARPKVVREVAEAAAHGDRSENAEYKYGKRRLREIDGRLRFVTRRLDAARVVAYTDVPNDQGRVFFGAFVQVEAEDGVCQSYQLVGVDEAAPSQGRLSYQSPLGKALMGRRASDVVVVERPAGPMEFELLSIGYGKPIASSARKADRRQ